MSSPHVAARLLGALLFSLPVASAESVGDFFDGFLHPSTGNGSVTAQIQCYGLPYGGLGVLSHALTYYTSLCLGLGVRPLMPWKWLEHKKWDAYVCLISMILTVTIAAFTMQSCHQSWPLLLMALWKLLLSFSANLVGMWRALTLKPPPANPPSYAALRNAPFEYNYNYQQQQQPQQQYGSSAYQGYAMVPQKRHAEAQESMYANDGSTWGRIQSHVQRRLSLAPLLGLLPYALGTVVGMVGLFAIVHETWGISHDVRMLTAALIVADVALVASVVFLLGVCCGCNPCAVAVSIPVGLAIGAAALVVFVVFYSDLVLAAVQGHWLGVPSGDQWQLQALYWVYYGAKRLPMLTF